jgi:FAD/FMN-containing dehydrogenase
MNVQRALRLAFGPRVTTREQNELLHMTAQRGTRLLHVARVNSVAEVRRALAVAAEHRLRVLMLGKGHRSRDASGDRDILCIAVRCLPLCDRIGPDTVRVSAGATWLAVERRLARFGLSSPVTTDYLALTVAGTVSVGGYGINSIAHGMQADHVRRLEAVTAGGEVVDAEPGDALFDYTAAGLHTFAVLTSVTMHVAPDAGPVRVATFQLDTLSQFPPIVEIASARYGRDLRSCDLTWFPRRGDISCRIGASAAVRIAEDDWGGVSPRAVELHTGYRRSLHRGVGSWYRPFRAAQKVWLDYILPLEHVPEFCSAVEQWCRDARIASHVECVFMIPISRAVEGHDLPFAAAAERGRRYMLIGLYCMPFASHEAATCIVALSREVLLPLCVALGGRPYQQSRHELTTDEHVRLYGDAYGACIRYASRRDPQNIFADWDGLSLVSGPGPNRM